MKRLISLAVAVAALALAGSAAAALSPWTFVGAGVVCSPTSTFSSGALHLSKPCDTTFNASAGATITGLTGQAFTSASFTLANASQCQGGSPRFNIDTTGGLFFLGCNNVTPTINANGTATYTFSPANLVPQLPGNTVGTIKSVDVVLDVKGTADLSNIMVNGLTQVPVAGPTTKDQCKKGGWQSFSSPSFKNQGQCVSFFNHQQHQNNHH